MIYHLLKKNQIPELKLFVNYNTKENHTEEYYTDNLTIVAIDDSFITGVITLHNLEEITLLVVDKEFYGQGIASQLLEYALFVAKDTVYTSLDSTFFEHKGFVKEEDKYIYHQYSSNKFHTYEEVAEFISSQRDRVYDLEHFKVFMDVLHNPQMLLSYIHIGGTNGKGSTCAYLKSVYARHYKVATFNSPALLDRLDILKVDNQRCDENAFVMYANRFVELSLEHNLSLFELEVFFSILYCISRNTELAIFEVGLGGNLDATNIITPMVAVNTNIGLDHIAYLGNTYTSIATAKAGIVKDNIPYITGEKREECLEVFRDTCAKHHSPLILTGKAENIKDGSQVEYDYKGIHIKLNTPALYQVENSLLAIEILEYMQRYFPVTKQDIIEGFYDCVWAGRFEELSKHPHIIIDGAHNKEGMEAFYNAAKKYDHPKIIFSALDDKDHHHMMEILLSLTDDVTITEFDHPRFGSAEGLAEDFPVKIDKDWKHAVNEALSYDGTIFITGSLYFLSKVRTYLLDILKSE